MKQVDLVCGKINDLEDDRQAGWEAFYRKDYECDALREEIAKLKDKIRKLENGMQKQGQLATRAVPKRRLRK